MDVILIEGLLDVILILVLALLAGQTEGKRRYLAWGIWGLVWGAIVALWFIGYKPMLGG